MVLELKEVSKIYRTSEREIPVLRSINFKLSAGDTCALVGPSGSGKTSLLALAGGLERATAGSVELNGQLLDGMSEAQLARVRNDCLGFVFQTFQLLPTLTALENVMVPAELHRDRQARGKALTLLERVGLEMRARHYPAQLSGGEQQRVALARALINRPRLILADEPTGNLDVDMAARVRELLFELPREAGSALLLATHDLELAKLAGRAVRLRQGELVEGVGQ